MPVTAVLASDIQPLTVHVAVIEYLSTTESVKLVPVEAFDQVTVPAQLEAVKVKVLGKQTTFSVGAVTVGALGFALISRPVTAILASDTQPLTVHVAVIEYLSTTESVKLEPVAALSLQVTVPAQPDDVKVRVLGKQTTFSVGAVTVKVGFALISRPVTAVLGSDTLPLTVQVAVIEYVSTVERVKIVPVADPCDQVTVPAQPKADKVKVFGKQTTFSVGAFRVGASGFSFI